MKQTQYLYKLLSFAYEKNPILFVYPIITMFSVFAELIAMMTLLPLSLIATGVSLQGKDPIVKILHKVHIDPTPRTLIIIFGSLFVLRIVSNLIAQNISFKYGKKLLAQLGSTAFGNIITHGKLDDIRDKSMGYYISLAGDEAFRASTIVIETHQLFASFTMATLYFLLIFWYSKMVALGLLVFLSFSFVLMGTLFKKVQKLGELQIEESKGAASIFLDGLNGLRTIRSFLAEHFVINAYSARIKAYTHTLYKIDFTTMLVKFLPILFLFVTLLISTLTNTWGSQEKAIDFAFILTSILFLMRFFPVLGQVVNVFLKLKSDAKAAKDVTEVVAWIPPPAVTGLLLKDPITTLALVDIHYAYSGHAPIFETLNMRFVAGESYAIVGGSGSGKSTLLNILMLLSDAQRGSIFINDAEHHTYDRNSLRKKIMLVEQESIIFNDTVFNNITLGESYTVSQVRDACKIACIDTFIEDLPGGYNFVLNYQGQNISGGQRQRIGIARMVLRSPDVILLDEVTSALDEETKHQLISNLLIHGKDKIVILVTHDPAIVDSVSQVFNLEKHMEETMELHHASVV